MTENGSAPRGAVFDRNPDLPDLPMALDLAKTEADRQALELPLAPNNMDISPVTGIYIEQTVARLYSLSASVIEAASEAIQPERK